MTDLDEVRAQVAAWLAEARLSKRDFYEEGDATIRITRPLTVSTR